MRSMVASTIFMYGLIWRRNPLHEESVQQASNRGSGLHRAKEEKQQRGPGNGKVRGKAYFCGLWAMKEIHSNPRCSVARLTADRMMTNGARIVLVMRLLATAMVGSQWVDVAKQA